MNKSLQKFPFFYVLIRSWDSFEWFDRCINSVFNQTYRNYKILFVDDASYYSKKQQEYIRKRLKNHVVIFNKIRRYSVYNAYCLIHKYAKNNDAVILNLDGDDWLLEKNSLKHIAAVYQKNRGCLLTYGECYIWGGKGLSEKKSRFIKHYSNIRYPIDIVRKLSYRRQPFYPFHPLTWRVSLYKKIKKKDFLRPDGSWLQYGQDLAIFFPLLEMANGRFKVLKKSLYVYNDANPLSDLKRNLIKHLKDELIIRKYIAYDPVS